eukprot:14798977-Heterocapsa_arctica.AAC.1
MESSWTSDSLPRLIDPWPHLAQSMMSPRHRPVAGSSQLGVPMPPRARPGRLQEVVVVTGDAGGHPPPHPESTQ